MSSNYSRLITVAGFRDGVRRGYACSGAQSSFRNILFVFLLIFFLTSHLYLSVLPFLFLLLFSHSLSIYFLLCFLLNLLLLLALLPFVNVTRGQTTDF